MRARGPSGHPSLVDAVPAPYWLDDPRPAGRLRARWPAAPRRTSSWWAVATSDSGRHCAPRSATRTRDVVVLEAVVLRARGERSQRRLLRGQPDPRLRQRPGPLARRSSARCSGSAGRTSTASARPSPSTASTVTWARPAASPWPPPHQVEELRADFAAMQRTACEPTWLDREEVHERVASPTYLAAVHEGTPPWSSRPGSPGGCGRPACALGVRVHEGPPSSGWTGTAPASRSRPRRAGPGAAGWCCHQRVPAAAAAAAADDRAGLRLRADDRAADPSSSSPLVAGARGRLGHANQFVYSRLTRDGRILWGGYDAVYHFGSGMRAELRPAPPTHTTLARLFFDHLPPARGARFSHAWGGVIDTCTRFTAFYGTALGGRVATRSASPGSGWRHPVRRRRAAGPARAGRTPNAPGWRWCAPDRPFPPEPLRWAGIEADPPVAGAGRCRRAAGRTSGCAPWTGSASASTPEQDPGGERTPWTTTTLLARHRAVLPELDGAVLRAPDRDRLRLGPPGHRRRRAAATSTSSPAS